MRSVKKVTGGVLAGTLAAALAASVAQPANAALRADAPSQADGPTTAAAHRPDNRPGPLTERQNELRTAAVKALLEGRAKKKDASQGGSTVTLAEGKSVEFLDNKKNARVLSILSEFGDKVVGKYGGTAGPLHNQIPEPGPTDNSTTWEPDYNTAYYENLFNGDGESFRNFYQHISGGQYTVDGTVQGWTKVPYNAAYYGANPREDEGGAWAFIGDTANSWYADKLRELGSKEKVDEYLSQFDQWDRYDHDGDGNFNEPDGYIDHFQAIHAGEGEEAGASPDAIWSHRWYVNQNQFGSTGPTLADGTQVLYGGAKIGDSKYFIGDYTVEPENGGLGVFAHEYGHDLGLPDFYDTAGGDNGTAFWTLMSSGSWLGHGDSANEGIGTTPGGMGPDERLFLGWLDHKVVTPGKGGKFTLSPAGLKTAASGTTQAVVVNLPDKTVTNSYTTPPEGTHAWWGGRDDNLNNTLTRPVPAAGSVSVSAAAWYDIESGYDYLYGEYSTDGGATWQSAGKPITGVSKGWTKLSWSYRPAGGKASLFRFRYQTDGGVNEPGAFLDTINVTADRTVVVNDGAESGDNGWTVKGWKISTGTDVQKAAQYYLVENRGYVGYDTTLQQGPYNFDKAYTAPNHVQFFPYQDGMLVWYADKSYADNNTSQHPGHGQALPVDARPEPFRYTDGTKPGNRRQPFDATFGLQKVDSFCLYKEVLVGTGKNQTVKTDQACPTDLAAKPEFYDSGENAYWSSANPGSSTKTAGSKVRATVLSESGGNLTVQVTNP